MSVVARTYAQYRDLGIVEASNGLVRAHATCVALAQQLDLAPEQILPFSTGVIMETLPIERIQAALPAVLADRGADRWADAAAAIMTTDTVPKAASRQVTIGGRTVTVTGIAKGAGMIRPNMATMLGFVATDANIAPRALQALAREAADRSFNRITVDGDTSTNDSFVLIAAILLQSGSGGGLSSSFGGVSSSSDSLLGTRQAGNLLTKTSWWGGALFLLLSFILLLLSTRQRAPKSVLDQAFSQPPAPVSAPASAGATSAVPLTPAAPQATTPAPATTTAPAPKP